MASPLSMVVRAVAPALVAFSGTIAQSSRDQRAARSTAHWVHESWGVDNGLPVNSINQLLQSRSGYIWAATFDGLVRFDGVRFTVFNSATSRVFEDRLDLSPPIFIDLARRIPRR